MVLRYGSGDAMNEQLTIENIEIAIAKLKAEGKDPWYADEFWYVDGIGFIWWSWPRNEEVL